MKKQIFYSLIIFSVSLSFIACKKEKSSNPDPNPVQSPTPTKTAKFEITGNYSGHLLVVYNDNVSGNTSVTVTSLPWSKTINYPSSVIGIGIGGNGIVQNAGVSGQSVNLKIYNGSSVVKSGTAIADVNGLVNMPTLAYTFP